MGIRDAWELAQAILDSAPDGCSAAMCATYASRAPLDATRIRFTDGLVRLFSNDLRCWAMCVCATQPAGSHPLAKKFVANDDVRSQRMIRNLKMQPYCLPISAQHGAVRGIGDEQALNW